MATSVRARVLGKTGDVKRDIDRLMALQCFLVVGRRVMTIRSMTGYGYAQGTEHGWTLTVECRSVNHRSLDIKITAPANLWSFEPTIRDRIKSQCGRGRLDCRVTLDHFGPGELRAEAQRQVKQVYDVLRSIQQLLDLPQPPQLSDLILAGLTPTALAAVLPEPEALEKMLVAVTGEAIGALVSSREKEGQGLGRELMGYLEQIQGLLIRIKGEAPVDLDMQRARLTRRIQDLLAPTGFNPPVEPERVYQEIAFQLDRSDITEEIVRSQSHVEALRSRLSATVPKGETIGKGLDFFLQELTREANTMASKSSSAELTGLVVEMKAEVERMREQVANIE